MCDVQMYKILFAVGLLQRTASSLFD